MNMPVVGPADDKAIGEGVGHGGKLAVLTAESTGFARHEKSPPDRSGGLVFEGLGAAYFCSLQALAIGAWAQGKALIRVSSGSLL